MLGFMDYVQQAWATSSHWDRDNSYGALTATARNLLDFRTPVGLALNLSSLSSPTFANSYTLSNAGVVDGSISYLYSSLPLTAPARTTEIALRHVIQGYRHLQDLRRPDEPWWWEIWHGGRRIDRRDTLLYGRLYLPQSLLEALYLRRLGPTSQLKISCVSSSAIRNGGSMLFLLSRDHGKYSSEYLYSTDSGLFGIRGLYNFGPDPRDREPLPDAAGLEVLGDALSSPSRQKTLPNGRFSAGAELYYGVLNKSGGMSVGCRFTTLTRHLGFPYTMTLTLNPLMGNVSSTYAVKAGPALALATRFDFNVYSYESEYQVGFELWKRKREDETVQWALDKIKRSEERGWVQEARVGAGKMMGGLEPEDAGVQEGAVKADDGLGKAIEDLRDEDTAGVLKARVNQDGALGLLWEGRVKQLLYTFGLNMDFRQREHIFRGVGVEFHYSS